MVFAARDEQAFNPRPHKAGRNVGPVGDECQPVPVRKLTCDLQGRGARIQKDRVACDDQISGRFAEFGLFRNVSDHPFTVRQVAGDLPQRHRAAMGAPDQPPRLEVNQVAAHRGVGHAKMAERSCVLA